MRTILEAVFDHTPPPGGDQPVSSFFEIGRNWGRSVITGLARLDGWPVAVISEDPYIYAGGWTADGSEKAVRLLDLANTFHLPIVHLADVPGFYIGSAAERDATIRKGSRAMAALMQCSSPLCTVIIRKAFGVAGGTVSVPSRAPYRFAWPSADWGSLPIEGGIEVAYKAELAAAEDRAALLEDITTRLNRVRSPFRTAETFGIEDIIDPRETRPLLCEWANLVAPIRRPGRFLHGYRP
jgi:acetyl-CoA carboxylase carboxyltransferase component